MSFECTIHKTFDFSFVIPPPTQNTTGRWSDLGSYTGCTVNLSNNGNVKALLPVVSVRVYSLTALSETTHAFKMIRLVVLHRSSSWIAFVH